MSSSPVSSLLPRHIQHSPTLDPRLSANEGETTSYLSTALKASAVIVSLIASIGTFIAIGPIAGIVTTLACGAGLLWLFDWCCPGSDHSRTHHDTVPVYIPWYQRVFSYVPSHSGPQYSPNAPHVPVGRGHMQQPHVPVGHGHTPPPDERPWYDGFARFMNNLPGGHVPVGGGHAPNRGNPTGGHVPVGRGHSPGGNQPPGNGPTQVPPPSGRGGHVPVGRRY